MNDQDQKYNIICLANQVWTYPLWTNKKHVMSRLGKQGHNVLFVDPSINTGFVFLKHVFQGLWSPKRLITQLMRDKESLVTVFSPLNCVPFYRILAKLHAKRVNRIAKRLIDPAKKTILWVYNVELIGLKDYLVSISHDFLIYDCVDNYAAFPKHNTPEKKQHVIEIEKYLASRSNLVFASAPGLVVSMSKYNNNTFYTPNVGDYERFKDAKKLKPLPEAFKDIPHPIIGFTGAVDEYKFDKELFKKIATDYPQYSFVVIGPLGLKDREASIKQLGLEGLNNVYFFGSKPYTQLNKYYAGFDAYVIPLQLNDYTVGGCFPVKFHEALAVGIPVIVTDLPAYKPFGEVSYISKSYNEFSQNIRKALEEDSAEKVKLRKKVAQENSWENKVENMLKIIGEHI